MLRTKVLDCRYDLGDKVQGQDKAVYRGKLFFPNCGESASMVAHILISSSLCYTDTIYKEWLQSYLFVHGIACGNIILLKYEITKY